MVQAGLELSVLSVYVWNDGDVVHDSHGLSLTMLLFLTRTKGQ